MGGSRSNAPATGSPSTTGIEMPALGSSGSPGDEGQEQAKMPKFEPRKPLVENSIQVPLDLVVACGPNGVVIHPGGYRISRATLRKEGLLRIDLKTIVRYIRNDYRGAEKSDVNPNAP